MDRVETQQDQLLRVHVLSPLSREVYFEVSRFENLPAKAEYKRHQEHLRKQFHPLAVSDLKEVSGSSLPAYEYSFKWHQGARTVILVEHANATYRILYNPDSALNGQILSTIEWMDIQ
ncbi:MAG TPA: hypothetical protein VFY83_11350 [Anaerolineales bacterium]|nr:hypothetical protein [Anaerolineales bacterium]